MSQKVCTCTRMHAHMHTLTHKHTYAHMHALVCTHKTRAQYEDEILNHRPLELRGAIEIIQSAVCKTMFQRGFYEPGAEGHM